MIVGQIPLTAFDYSAIVLYALVVVGLGGWFAREQLTSTDYILAGRSMGWVAVGISQLASLLSAISYLGNPGEAYAYDLGYLFFTICGFLSVPLVIHLFLNFFYTLEITSIYAYLERRFNFPTRLLASAIFVAARVAWMGTIVTAVSVVMETLTGLDPSICIIVTTVVATGYTLVGGMKAIIWTDVIQFFLFTLGLAGAIGLILWNDGVSAVVSEVVAAEKLSMFDFSFDLTARMTVWTSISAGVIVGMANLTDQVSMQRYLSTRTLRDAQKAVWMKPILSIPVATLTMVLGLALFAHYQIHPELADFEQADKAFPHFILHEMTGGLAGVILAAIFAAAMSSIDSGTHTVSTVCVEDYYKRLINPHAPDRACLNLARVLTVVWGVIIAVVALMLAGKQTILGTMYSVVAPFFGCAVGMFALGTATRRATAWGAFLGALVGYGLVLWVRYGFVQVDGSWELFAWNLDTDVRAGGKPVSKFWLSFVSFGGTIASGYLLSFLWRRKSDGELGGLTIWTSPKGSSDDSDD